MRSEYPSSIRNIEKEFIQSRLINAKGWLKAAAMANLPEYLKSEIFSLALERGLKTDNLPEAVYWLANDLTDYPKHCPTCNSPITSFHSYGGAYPSTYCSLSCSNSNKEVIEKKMNSMPQNKKPRKETRPKQNKITKQLGTDYTLLSENGNTIKWRHKCGYESTSTIKNGILTNLICPSCYNINSEEINEEIFKFIRSNTSLEVLKDVDICEELNLCVYIPELYLGIECYSIENISFNSFETNSEKMMLKDKADFCEEIGIQIIQIYDYEWIEKNQLIKDKLLSLLGMNIKIPARKCEIKEIATGKEISEFQNTQHIQGAAQASVRLGLFYNDELVALMTFGHPRFSKKYQWELIRYCSKDIVVGGASKLFKYFIANWNPENIVSYADRRWSQAKLYKILGFSYIENSNPNYFYYKDGLRLPRYAMQKHKMSKWLDHFDPSKTEHDNAFANGYRRVWDAGNAVLIWKA